MKPCIHLPAHLLIAILVVAVGQCLAQTTPASEDRTEAQLITRVHLSLGATTAAEAVAVLSRQTGLTITVADYLKQRKMTVLLDNVSATAALNALCELNDWIWYKTEPNHILLSRSKLRMAAQSASIPRLVKAALPADLRAFLDIARPDEDLSRAVYDLHQVGKPSQYKANQTLRGINNRLLSTLNRDELQKKALTYTQLTEAQQDDLLGFIVFGALSGFDYDLLHSDPPPYLMNLAVTMLSLGNQGTAFKVGAPVQVDGQNVIFSFMMTGIPSLFTEPQAH
jgi:hypothetical protein